METATPSPTPTALPPLWLRHALWWLQCHSLYERWANTIWYALHRRRPSEAELDDAAEQTLDYWAVEFDQWRIDEPLHEFCSRWLEGLREVKDHNRVAVYERAAELARERPKWSTSLTTEGREALRPSVQVTLPSTRSRESRPRRRTTASALASGDDDPEPEPLDARHSRLGGEAA